MLRWIKPEPIADMPTLKNHTSTLIGNKVKKKQMAPHTQMSDSKARTNYTHVHRPATLPTILHPSNPPPQHTPTHPHTHTHISTQQIFVFGGYDGQRNHSTLHVFDHTTLRWVTQKVAGKAPPGRNGHTATLAEGKLFIIGGWLGSGPLAASDVHYIDLAEMKWVEPPMVGDAPGPCNMHTSDYMPHKRRIFVFRGGDGREYLNDLHGLDVDTFRWERLQCTVSKIIKINNHFPSSTFSVHQHTHTHTHTHTGKSTRGPGEPLLGRP
jgi:hypothetical protein